MMGFRKYGISP